MKKKIKCPRCHGDGYIEEWQDEENTYTPNERQLDCRLDRRISL